MTVPPGGEAAYQARRYAEFRRLRAGDTVTAMVGGRRVVATVVDALQPDVLVQTEDGERHVLNVHSFGARIEGPG